MEDNFDDIWINYAVLCKISISKIAEVREYINSIGSFIYDKHSAYDIRLVIDKPKLNLSDEGVDIDSK